VPAPPSTPTAHPAGQVGNGSVIDVDDVALGHETRQRWNTPDKWVWSTGVAHDPIIDTDTYRQA
jgi:hypothetical protein